MILRHYIDFLDGNGFTSVQPPQEWKNLSIQLSFESNNEKLSSTNFSWVGDNAELINDYITGGVTGTTNGIFEGLPYQVRFTCDNVQHTLFDGCINIASSDASFSCEEVKVGIREKGKIDYVNDMIDSFRFEYLFAIRQVPTITNPFAVPVAGQITYNDFIDIWYVQGQYPQKFEIMITSLTLFVSLKETYETVKRLLDVIAEIFSVPSGGITSALQLIYLGVYLGLLIVALINLFQKMIDLIFPFVYFHRAMYTRVLFQKACDYLGLNFSSTIFSVGGLGYNEYLMPEKNEEGTKVGYASDETGFYNGTFGDLVRAYKEKFNAEVRIIGNTFYFEHEEYFINQSNFIIPDIYNKPNNAHGYNANEVASNYVISYRYDVADLNNLSRRDGTQFTAKIEPNVVTNKQNVLIKNLEERNIPFTLPLVKTEMSELEKTMTSVFNAITGVINAVSSVISPSSPSIPSIPSNGQVDVLLLDTHLLSAPKVGIYQGGGKTRGDSISSYLNTSILWGAFHASRSAYGVAPFQPNQWWTYKDFQIPLCCEEYLLIKDNNYGTYLGNDSKIIKADWVAYDQEAKIDFAVRKPYTNNLKLTTIAWDGTTNVYT